MISLYQGRNGKWYTEIKSDLVPFVGTAIMIVSLILFENEFLHIVSISFTALILNELIMVALEITTWYILLLDSSTLLTFRKGTRTWSFQRWRPYSSMLSVWPSFQPILVSNPNSLIDFHSLISSFKRPLICCDFTICMESSGHRRHQRPSFVHHQGNQTESCTGGFK